MQMLPWKPSLASRTRLFLALAAGASVGCNSSESAPGGSTGPGGGFEQPRISISVPAANAIRQGATVQVPVTISRTAYFGVVIVSFSGLPAGVTGPSVVSTSTGQLAFPLVADSLAPLAAATVTVTAQGSDVAAVSTTFTLTVSPR